MDLRDVRRRASDCTFFEPSDLGATLATLGFVQADPIRAPARAQDLILRQRANHYRAGDLERRYPTLPVVEEMLHVYGFMHRSLRGLLHPRRIARRWHVEDEHPRLRRAILGHLAEAGASHPRDIERALIAQRAIHPDRSSIVNGWGGVSNTTTRMLEVLHHRGLLHVVRRDNGIRVYELAAAPLEAGLALTPKQRADGLIRLLVSMYRPVPKSSLGHMVYLLHDRGLPRDGMHERIALMIRRGELLATTIDGVTYIDTHAPVAPAAVEPRVRFVAPFDPLVWDRRRFRHLFGWEYRFEAYMPAPKRLYGYYALPLVWDTGDDVRIPGWVNATRVVGPRGPKLVVKAGFVKTRPKDAGFKAAFDAEVARLEAFVAREAVQDATP